MTATPPALRLRHITKRFGALVANDDISLDLAPGEVLALLGENGAGKSTLVSILFGHYRADAGDIAVHGRPLPPGNARAALAAGIGMVHQHFTLADNLSVLDNVMLGSEPLWLPWSRRRAARKRLLQTAQRFGLHVDPEARVGALSVGERQRVEILKALVSGRGGTRILILDEPTAVLTPAEAESLFNTLQRLVAQGLSLIFISHKLDEVLRVSHRIAVLRGGRLVATLPAANASKAQLAECMVGRSVPAVQRRGHAPGAPVCTLHGVSVRGGGARPLLADLNLQVHAGEVLAIAGVSGNGQQALAELLFGLRAADQGEVRLLGRPMPARPRAWVDAGVARIPEDRHATGVVGDLPLWENAVMERLHQGAVSRLGWVRRGAAQGHARRIVAAFDVRGTDAQGVATPTRALSGGNMQKLILGRALMPPGSAEAANADANADANANAVADAAAAAFARRPHVPPLIVADQPTWGLDIGAVAEVHQRLLDACAAGAAVLLICEDLDEIYAIADRVAVMHQGRLTPARPTADWRRADIGLAMSGHGTEALHAP